MNTNLMTICNLLAQQSGKHVLSPNVSPEIDQSALVHLNKSCTSHKGTDNSPSESKNKSKTSDSMGFENALRQKMNYGDSEQAQNSQNNIKEEKDSRKNTTDTDFQRINVPVINHLMPETIANNPTIDLMIVSPVEIATETADNINEVLTTLENEVIPVKNDDSGEAAVVQTDSFTADIANTEKIIPISMAITTGNVVSNSAPDTPDTLSITIEATQAGFNNEEIPQQEPITQQAVLDTSNLDPEVEVSPRSSRAFAPSQQQNQTNNNFLSAENADKLLLDKVSSNSVVIPSPSQKNISAANPEEPQNTATDLATHQKSDLKDDFKSEIQPAQSSIHRMNVAAEQMSVVQTEKSHFQAVKEEIKIASESTEETPEDTTKPFIFIEQPTVSHDSPKTVGNINSGLGLGRQIQETISSFYRPGTQQIVIRLDPPDLGRVTIKFIENRNGITGILHVDKAQTKDQIQEALPGIVQNLQNLNISVKKLDVLLSNQQHNTSSGEQSEKHNNPFDHHPHNSHSFDNSNSYHDWHTNRNNTQEVQDSQTQATDDSINMLI